MNDSARLEVRVLVVDDDRDDYVLVREQLEESASQTYRVDWAGSFEAGLEAICRREHDVYLLDQNLGARTGIDLMRAVSMRGCAGPHILMTGLSDPDLDREALENGAVDFLVKGRTDTEQLERSIRYGIEHFGTLAKLRASERRLDAALQRSERRFRALSDANVVGIFVARPDGTAVEANDAFLRITGYDRRALTEDRVRCDISLKAAAGEPGLEVLLRAVQSDAPVETELLRPDGSRAPVLIGAARADEETGEIVGFAVDLTEARMREQQILMARLEAEAASSAKDRFLATLSHELRTPLTPLLSATELLSSMATEDPAVSGILDVMSRNIKTEVRLIDDLLDLSRIIQGKLSVELQTIDAHAVIRRAVDICRDSLTSRQLKLGMSLDAESTLVIGDSTRLEQVVWNLLMNAIKFTPVGGSIDVSTQLNAGQFMLSVRDSGIGIAPEALPNIFKAFEQGDSSVTRKFGGMGLGLSISSMLVDLVGGSISAHSDGLGRGATFIVALNLVTSSTANGSKLAHSISQEGHSERRGS